MRMKKIMILAVAAIALAACSRTFETHEVKGQEIGFGTWTEVMTKRIQGTGTWASGDDFAVFGSKYMDADVADLSKYVVVFNSTNDVEVEYDGSDWDYTPHRFWDSNYEKYVFYAVSPFTVGAAATVNEKSGTIETTGITFDGNNNDILVADKMIVASGNSGNAVQIQFNHMASLVDVAVKKSPALKDANATVTVSAIQLEDIESAGALTVSDAYTSNHPVGVWSSTATDDYGPSNGVEPVDISSPIAIAEDTTFPGADDSYTPDNYTCLIHNLVVKPQTFGGSDPAERSDSDTFQKLTITYQIAITNGDTFEHTSTLYLADFDKIDNTAQAATYVGAWEAGKHYIFYITIDANAISFDAAVTNWTDASGYHYLIN